MYYENETYTFIETVEFSLPDVIKDTDKIFFRFDCVDAPSMREVPYTLFASKLLPCYNKNQVDELINNKADKPKKVIFNDMGTLNLADNTIYEAEGELLNPYFNYPEGDFMCSITFTLANMEDFDVTVTLPQSKYIGGVPTFAKGETWELNIKNGVVVGGLVE